MTNLLILFITMNALNVVLQTVKSLCTVNCGKTIAAIVNAVTFGFYTVIVVYMSCDLPLWEKSVIIGACNLVGVYVVKFIEEKATKDKLWLIQATVKTYQIGGVNQFLESVNIPYSYVIDETERYAIYNIYCATQKESTSVKELVKTFRAKYFVNESKRL